MLLSKKKINNIHQMFIVPYRPILSNYQLEKVKMNTINNNNSVNSLSSIMKKNSNYSKTLDLDNNYNKNSKNSFSSYNDSIIDNNYSIDDNAYSTYNPQRNEITINNSKEIINSCCSKESIKNHHYISSISKDSDEINLINEQNIKLQNNNRNMNNKKKIFFNYIEKKHKKRNFFTKELYNTKEQKNKRFKDSKNQYQLKNFNTISVAVEEKKDNIFHKNNLKEKLNDSKKPLRSKILNMKNEIKKKYYFDFGDSIKDTINTNDYSTLNNNGESYKEKIADFQDSLQIKIEDLENKNILLNDNDDTQKELDTGKNSIKAKFKDQRDNIKEKKYLNSIKKIK